METMTMIAFILMCIVLAAGLSITIVEGIQSIKLARQIRLKIEELKIKDLEITKK